MLNRPTLVSFAVAAALLGSVGFAGTAYAQGEPEPVGVPGTPTCHGLRVSTGSSHSVAKDGRGITPVDRAGFLSEIAGTEISVSQFHQWVRFNCDSPGPQLDLESMFPQG